MPGGENVVTSGRDQTLRIWDSRSGRNIRTLHIHMDDVLALRLSPFRLELPMVASASADRTIRFWRSTIGRMVRFVRLPATPLEMVWIDAGRELLACCDDGKVRRIGPEKVRITEVLDALDSWPYSIAFDATSDRVYVGGPDSLLAEIELPR